MSLLLPLLGLACLCADHAATDFYLSLASGDTRKTLDSSGSSNDMSSSCSSSNSGSRWWWLLVVCNASLAHLCVSVSSHHRHSAASIRRVSLPCLRKHSYHHCLYALEFILVCVAVLGAKQCDRKRSRPSAFCLVLRAVRWTGHTLSIHSRAGSAMPPCSDTSWQVSVIMT